MAKNLHEMPELNRRVIRKLTDDDLNGLVNAHLNYGDSWKRRGGVGAFMMLARKFDRIENQCLQQGYDIFQVVALQHNKPDGILDDIRDLRRYLLLVEQEVFLRSKNLESLTAMARGDLHPQPETSETKISDDDGEPTGRYVGQ